MLACGISVVTSYGLAHRMSCCGFRRPNALDVRGKNLRWHLVGSRCGHGVWRADMDVQHKLAHAERYGEVVISKVILSQSPIAGSRFHRGTRLLTSK